MEEKVKFAYATMPMFFDADDVPCVFSHDVMVLHHIPQSLVYAKSWDISGKLVMALKDFLKLKTTYYVNNNS